MMEDRFEEVLREAAQDYHRPPETPRELMWARLEAARRERARERERLRFLRAPWVRWGLGMAAALAIGIGIGRVTLPDGREAESVAGEGPVSDTPAGPGRPEPGLAYRLAATEHLTRAETFLTSFRADPETSGADGEFWSGAGELLSSTRLLLDSPAADDPVFRSLLEDLELVLVQIARLSETQGETEVELVREGMEHRGLLTRLRTAIPAGPAVGMEGVL